MTDLITRERLRQWGSCDERIAKLIPPDGLPLADVLRLDINAGDRVWIAAQPGAIPEPLRCRWLGRIVRRALGRAASPDPRSLAVLVALDAGRWPDEQIRNYAAAAYEAAGAIADASATYRSDFYAARAAVQAAYAGHVLDRATDASGFAVEATAEAAAFAAAFALDPIDSSAYFAGHAAERDQQITDLLELLAEEVQIESAREGAESEE